MKKNKAGRPKKYDFSVIRKGKWVEILSDSVLGCREAARQYSVKKGFSIVTKIKDDKLLIYRL